MFNYIKQNPKLSKMFTTDGLVIIFMIASGVLANFGDILPAGIAAGLGTIIKIYNIVVTTGILDGRGQIIEEVTGKSLNEVFADGIELDATPGPMADFTDETILPEDGEGNKIEVME